MRRTTVVRIAPKLSCKRVQENASEASFIGSLVGFSDRQVDPLTCPACGGAMRILAFLTERAVIDRILEHLRRTRADARGPPSTRGPARRTDVHGVRVPA